MVEGGNPTFTQKVEQWMEKNPDTATGLQHSFQNLMGGGSPQQNVMEGAAEAAGAALGESLQKEYFSDSDEE